MGKRCFFWLLMMVVFVWTAGGVAAAPTGKVTIGLSGEPSTFDPHRITGLPLQFAYPLVFDNLFYYDYSGKLIPRLAKSHRQVKPKMWEFKIREGIKFSNGEPLDAHAVKFSIDRIMDPKLKSRQFGFFRSIDRIEVVDRYTMRIHTKYPDTFLIPPLALLGQVVPPKYYKSHDLKYLARHPVGSGPYRLVKWSKGEELVYEANPNYWRPGVPRIKTGVVKIISEPTTRVSALLAGDVDIIDVVPPQLVTMVKSKADKLDIVSGQSSRSCRVIMIIKPGAPWDNVKVREALNYAVDKDSIIKNIMQGHATKVATHVGPYSFGHNPNLKPYPYDPAKARKLLAEAGYPNGFSVNMYLPLGRFLMGKQAGEAIAGMMAKVGVKVRVHTPEWGKNVKLMKARWEPHSKPFWWYSCRMDLFLHSEGMFSGDIHSKSVWSGFRDKAVDKLLNSARTEPDDAKRAQKYREINRVLHVEKVPMIFLYQLNQINAKNKRVDWKMRPNALMLLSDMGLK